MPQTEIRVFRDARRRIPLVEWLDELETREPKAWQKCLQRILDLERLGNELRRPLADSLRDGIRELRVRSGNVHYRILHFFHGRHAVVLSHGITKQGKVPDREIQIAVERKLLVQSDARKYTAEWVDG